ncbi:hypothetical protein [Nitratireductor indicus]|uniref:hypothetical protein n=1 Tax=Nitratireductor indicus TaxID=721133 RepID=UPI002874883E|nr:hypothetical protein [Nitratireductor indicus]MDS1135438.1 hypothetical protein [Nitratireductor indicus]
MGNADEELADGACCGTRSVFIDADQTADGFTVNSNSLLCERWPRLNHCRSNAAYHQHQH